MKSRAAARRRLPARLLPGLLTLLLAAGLQAQEQDATDTLVAARQRGVLEVALYGEFPPYSSGSAADAKGIDVDIARDLATALGLKLKVRLVDAGESLSDDLRNHLWKGHYMGGGVADVMLHVGYDPQFVKRESNVTFFSPYFHESIVVAYHPERIKHLESPVALSEHRIGVEGDTISDHILSSAYGGALRTSAVRESSLQEAVKAFKSGDVDAVMGPHGELEGLFQEMDVQGIAWHQQERVGQMRTGWDVALAVRKSGGDALVAALGEQLGKMRASGELQQIFKAHGVQYVDSEMPGTGEHGQ